MACVTPERAERAERVETYKKGKKVGLSCLFVDVVVMVDVDMMWWWMC